MTALQSLESYLLAVERRLRLLMTARGLVLTAFCALVLTLALAWFANVYKFDRRVVLPSRVLLFGALACMVTFALAIPLARFNRKRAARFAEAKIPDFKERLLTLSERSENANPFHELLAEDTLRIAVGHPSESLVSPPMLYGFAAAAAAGIAVLLWMILASPGYLGYGASLLWTGTARAGSRPLYEIAVKPGDAVIRRKSDQVIAAQLLGFSAHAVILHAKYEGSLKWDEIPMQTRPDGDGYELLFVGLSDSLDYYVQADNAQSQQFTVRVKDLPRVQRLRIALHYPRGIGLKDVVNDPGGDIRAVQGSQAEISVLTDTPLEHGLLVFEDGSRVPLSSTNVTSNASGNWLQATIPILKDGSYHVAAMDNSETVRISDDYFIEATKDEPPSIRILQPGRDPHVSPIEEVPVRVAASDDFAIRGLDLHYSINGGPEQVKPLLKNVKENVKDVESKTTLCFEDFKVAPGDLVSFYATAQDGAHTSRSDIIFAQAEPFEFKFRQSQQAGGGGGGAADQGNNISERQKEIIAATWNQLKDGGNQEAALTRNAQFLSGLQRKLGEQAKALSERMGNRELAGTNPEFEEFSKSMLKASAEMSTAADRLQPGKWNAALPPEQQALQSLLRAESLFRDIQVAFGQSGGGGMGANGQERELSRLFDLELDTSKNQYETAQTPTQNRQDQQRQIDDALQRLKDLAKRQQELAAEQHSPQQDFKQRWEQEQLRREAEQLREQMQQLSRNSESQTQPATDALRRAEDEMRGAVGTRDATAQQRAAGQLAQAQESLSDMLRQQQGNGISDLTQRARQLAAAQRELGDRVKQLYGAGGINTARPSQMADGSPEMPEMSGPDYASGWYRRHGMPLPSHSPTQSEKDLSAKSERLSQETQQLQDKMRQQAQSMAAEQPEATRKLRGALSDAEQQELATRMQKNSEWLRDGYGEQVWPMEDSITAATGQLARELQEVQQALDNKKPGTGSSEEEKVAQALAQVQSLRQQMEAAAAGRPVLGGGTAGQDAIRRLDSLRAQLGRNDTRLNESFNYAIGSIRRFDSKSGLLEARIDEGLTSLSRLELELQRRLGLQNDSARSGAPESAPEAYRQAVAQYFRTLSK